MSTFLELGVNKKYMEALKELNIKSPTEIQELTIPILLEKTTDFVGLAQTGTGKTAAFGLPILHKINPELPAIQTLILSPTRELVQQIKKQLFRFTKYTEDKVFIEAVYGGEKIDKQLANLSRTTHIVVATPGRLIDLIERGSINLKQVNTVVLDEADEMLSMGFKQDINKVLRYCGKSSKTWLFSATMPEEIRAIIKKYMTSDAERIEITKNRSVNENITHRYIKTTIKEKTNDIVRFLEGIDDARGIIFCRTKAGTRNLVGQLMEEGFSVGALEGDMQQKERDKVMRAFKNKTIQIMVSTDVSARGIDVQNLGFVLHHQLPEKMEYYTHRSGRTARAGKTGVSIAFIIPNEVEKIKEIQSTLGIYFKEIK